MAGTTFNTAPLAQGGTTCSSGARPVDRHGWGFAALLLAVAVLFLRPADLLVTFDDWPIYQLLIILCLACSLRGALTQLGERALRQQPVTCCLVVLVLATAMSHLAHEFFWAARMSSSMVAKVVLLYLLVTALVNTPRRLATFVTWLTLAIVCMASLSLLDDAGVLSIPSLESIRDREVSVDGGVTEVMRLRGTGIFHDPNDLGLMVVPGLVFAVYKFAKPKAGFVRHVWLFAAAVLVVALIKTHSRGALLSLAATVPAYLYVTRGWKTALVGTIAAVPVFGWLFAGRMTELGSLSDGTGQSRIQIWSDNLIVFRRNPFFGIGEGMLVEDFGVVSHNSFLQCFVELGFFGGTAFLAAFLVVVFGLNRATPDLHESAEDAELGRLRCYVFTSIVGYAVGLLSLSRQFVAPTFLLLGLAVATQKISGNRWPRGFQPGPAFVLRAFGASVLFLTMMHFSVLLLIRR